MNTVRILICATFALLIAALVHAYSTKGEPKEKSLSELREELERIKLKKRIEIENRASTTPAIYDQQNTPYTTAAPIHVNPAPAVTVTAPVHTPPFVNPLAPTAVTIPTVPTAPVMPDSGERSIADATISELDALKAENAKLKEERSRQESENKMLHVEAGAIQNELQALNKSENARAAEVAQALVMARVKNYDPDSGIIVLDLVLPQNLITGQILGIRRGSAGGIIGRIKLGTIQSSEIGFADPIAESFWGDPVSVNVGDEIIVIP